VNVTADPGTVILFTGGKGSATGTNGSTYVPASGEIDTVSVSATYSGKSATATLNVLGHGALSIAKISPKQSSVTVGTPVTFSLEATYADGAQLDVTPNSTFTVQHGVGNLVGNTYTGVRTESAIIQGSYTEAGKTVSDLGYIDENLAANGLAAITLSTPNTTVPMNTPVPFTVTAHYANGTTSVVTNNATFSIGHGWGTLSGNTFTPDRPQSAVINCTYTEGGITANAVAYEEVTYVGHGNVTGLTMTASAASVPMGTPVTLSATARYQDGTTSDVTNSTTFSISHGWGTLTGNTFTPDRPQSAVIGGSYTENGITVQSVAYVAATYVGHGNVTGITLSASATSVPMGTPVTLTATARYQDGFTKDVTNNTTFSISHGWGTLTGNTFTPDRPQSAVIGGSYSENGITVQSVVYITATYVGHGLPVGLVLSPNSETVNVGTAVTFTATVRFQDGYTADMASTTVFTIGHGVGTIVGNTFTPTVPQSAVIDASFTQGGTTVTAVAYIRASNP